VVFELADLDDFTLWNNDGPTMVEIEFFAVSAVKGRAAGGERWGRGVLREQARARALGQWRLKPHFSQGWVVGIETGVIVSFKGRTFK
jgi:hypothetical protein